MPYEDEKFLKIMEGQVVKVEIIMKPPCHWEILRWPYQTRVMVEK